MNIDDPCTCVMPGRDFNCPSCLQAEQLLQQFDENDPPGHRWFNRAEGTYVYEIDLSSIMHAARNTPRCADCHSQGTIQLHRIETEDPDDYETVTGHAPYDWCYAIAHDRHCPQMLATHPHGNNAA